MISPPPSPRRGLPGADGAQPCGSRSRLALLAGGALALQRLGGDGRDKLRDGPRCARPADHHRHRDGDDPAHDAGRCLVRVVRHARVGRGRLQRPGRGRAGAGAIDDTKLRAQVANAEAALVAARARVRQADASAREAKENYEAEAALDQRGVTTRRSFVSFEALYNRAEAEREIARADEATAEANLVLQKADLEKSVIRSPIAGVVLGRTIDPGQIVASSLNTPTLFTLAEDLSRMELRVDVDEADIGRVAVGNAATFTVDAYGGRSFPATIHPGALCARDDEWVVTYKAILAVDNADLSLRPGMTATPPSSWPRSLTRFWCPMPRCAMPRPKSAVATEEEEGGGGGLIGLIIPDRPAETVAPAGGPAVWVLRDGTPNASRSRRAIPTGR